jgi:hypothetical protein
MKVHLVSVQLVSTDDSRSLTSPDPQPGDIDELLAALDVDAVEVHDGHPAAHLRVIADAPEAPE